MSSLTATSASGSTNAATTTTAGAVADAFVSSAAPTINYGSSTTLQENANPANAAVSYITFDVQGLSAAPSAATLRLYSGSTGVTPTRVSAVSAGWSETGITWDNRPTPGPSIGSTGALTNGWVSADVSSAIKGNGLVSFALTTTATATRYDSSREGTSPPQLVVTSGTTTTVPSTSVPPTTAPSTGGPAAAPAFAYYYLWWDTGHWTTTLGSHYPYNANPLPLPATLAANGCSPHSNYPGNIETDVPAQLFSQSDQSQINLDVNNAIASGLTGFAVNWKGTGASNQVPASNYLDQRLDMVVQAVDAAQQAGHNFHLWLSYEASAAKLSQTGMVNDLNYLHSRYGSDPAFDRTNGGKPTFIWVGSYKYPTSTVSALTNQFRSDFYLVGGYQWNQWNTTIAGYFDADSPYWSSQDPYNNNASFQQLAGLASTLHSEHKEYFAPLAPGFDRELDGSTGCVPRNNGQTLRTIYSGNLSGNPDGWLVISWNEITEGTYVTPQLQRYGALYGGPNGVLHQLLHPSGG